jgi:hypothetical protein
MDGDLPGNSGNNIYGGKERRMDLIEDLEEDKLRVSK